MNLRTILRNGIVAATLYVTGAGLSCIHAEALSPPLAPGVYDILICNGSCAFGSDKNVVVHGQIALLPSPLDRADIERLDPDYYPTRSHEVPNACFVLERLPGRTYLGFAGMDRFGVTGWLIEKGTLRFALAHTPDAGYEAAVQLSPVGFEGEGRSWGGAVVNTSDGPEPADKLIARRVGASDANTCFRLHQTDAAMNSRSH